MKEIQVLILTHMYPRFTDATNGIFIHYQVRHLKMQGCEVEVVSPIPYTPAILATNERRKGYRQTPVESEIDGVSVRYPRYLRPPGAFFHPFSCYTMAHTYRRNITQVIDKFRPHLIHAHTATPDGYAGVSLTKKFGLPLVVSLRGSDVDVYPYRDRWTLRLTRKVVAEADQVTAVSQALKEKAQRIARPRQDIEVVYTGCDLEKFKFDETARAAYRRRLGISPQSCVLLFIGALVEDKGIFELLNAFQVISHAHPDTWLIVVGSGPEAQAIADKIVKGDIKKRVHLAGAQPHDDIPRWLSASDILILPSHHEGLPNVVIEAMACRRPVVATHVGGIPEAVEDGESGILVERSDVEALADAIALLAEDPTRRAAMGVAGRRIVEGRFTWEKNAEKMIEVYREVLNAG